VVRAAVVHLAAKLGGELSEIDSIVSANVIGTYNIMEAARRCNLRRVVFASAGAVSMNREHEEPFLTLTNPHVPPPEAWEKITHLDEPRPHGLYGAAPSTSPWRLDLSGLSAVCLLLFVVVSEPCV